MKTYDIGSHLKCLCNALPMITQNICFHGKTRKMSNTFRLKNVKSVLSGAIHSNVVCSLGRADSAEDTLMRFYSFFPRK